VDTTHRPETIKQQAANKLHFPIEMNDPSNLKGHIELDS
jgi:hypothetical protein